MSNSIVQLAPDGTGKKVDTSQITVGANSVERQRIVLGDDSGAAALAKVGNATPSASDYGLTVRQAGTALQAAESPATTTGTMNASGSVISYPLTSNMKSVTVAFTGNYSATVAFQVSFDAASPTNFVDVFANWRDSNAASTNPIGYDLTHFCGLSAGSVGGVAFAEIPIPSGATFLKVYHTAYNSGSAAVRITPTTTQAQMPSSMQVTGGSRAGSDAIAFTSVRPVIVGGLTGTGNGPSYPINVDTNGMQRIVGAAANGAALVGNPLRVGGSDGTNMRDLSVDALGRLNVNVLTAAVAGTALTGDNGIQYRANATGGATARHVVAAAGTNATSVKTSAGRLIGWNLANTSAAFKYLKLHNQNSAPTAGSGVVQTIAIPPNSVSQMSLEGGLSFTSGIAFTITGAWADADATAVAAGDVVGDLFYA